MLESLVLCLSYKCWGWLILLLIIIVLHFRISISINTKKFFYECRITFHFIIEEIRQDLKKNQTSSDCAQLLELSLKSNRYKDYLQRITSIKFLITFLYTDRDKSFEKSIFADPLVNGFLSILKFSLQFFVIVIVVTPFLRYKLQQTNHRQEILPVT